MGAGAVLDYQYIPGDTADEPNEILVTLRPGADLAAARARLQRIVPIADGGVISGVQRPAEITDYRSMGVAPLILAGALAAGAVASLWLTLAVSVRRRAGLALLETLGLTGRQLATTVACQSTVTVAAGTLICVPWASRSAATCGFCSPPDQRRSRAVGHRAQGHRRDRGGPGDGEPGRGHPRPHRRPNLGRRPAAGGVNMTPVWLVVRSP